MIKKQKKKKYEKPTLKSIKKSELKFEAALGAVGADPEVSGGSGCNAIP